MLHFQKRTLNQVKVFWVVTPCSVVLGHQHFGGPCCLQFYFTLKMKTAWPSKTMVSYHNTAWQHNSENPDLILHYLENLNSQKY